MIDHVLGCLLASASAAAVGDAPDRLLTRQGVDIVLDENIFFLFAALNAAGYSEETEREGPPLVAPIFHPVRTETRQILREAPVAASLRAVRAVFEAHPVPIEVYLQAVLAGESAVRPAAQLRASLLPALTRFRREAALETLFDRLSDRLRTHALALRAQLETDFDRAGRVLGKGSLRAPRNVVVMPNLLDAHAETRTVRSVRARYLVVGPGFRPARTAVIEDAVAAILRPAARRAFAEAPGFRRSWNGLKASQRIRARYPNGAQYLAQAVARAVAHRVVHPTPHRDADEDFISDQAKLGMRWARVGLRFVDATDRGDLTVTLPSLARKTSP